jgi:hypothetical protein
MFAVWSFYAFWAFLHNNIFLVVFILKVDLSTFPFGLVFLRRGSVRVCGVLKAKYK